MTYREKIQSIIKQIETVYDDAECLRDFATEDEKKHWNELRRIFYDADAPMRKLNNSLSQNRANTKI